MYEFKNLLNV